MNFDLLRDNLDLLLDWPGQITKLNQAILQLAVQGKLVSQVPTENLLVNSLSALKQNAHS